VHGSSSSSSRGSTWHAVATLARASAQEGVWATVGSDDEDDVGDEDEDGDRDNLTTVTSTTSTATSMPFRAVDGGGCLARGWLPISNSSMCAEAATVLGLQPRDGGDLVKVAQEDSGFEGCFHHGGQVWIPESRANRIKKRKVPASASELVSSPEPPSGALSLCLIPLSVWDTAGRRRSLFRVLEPSDEGGFEVDTDYPGEFFHSTEVEGVQQCRDQCLRIMTCASWSWKSSVEAGEANCWLKSGNPERKERVLGVTSGFPSKKRRDVVPATGHLFCFTVVRESTEDVSRMDKVLMDFQFRRGVGIFACDDYSLYSRFEVGAEDGVYTTSLMEGNITCLRDHTFLSCYARELQRMVWHTVVTEGKFKEFAWTVKVAPSAVFLPSRLRVVLANAASTGKAAYINNCKFGLHGPLQVLTREAVAIFDGRVSECATRSLEEAAFAYAQDDGALMEFCLATVMDVPRIDRFGILGDEHCGIDGWAECSGFSAAYEPMENPRTFGMCLDRVIGQSMLDALRTTRTTRTTSTTSLW